MASEAANIAQLQQSPRLTDRIRSAFQGWFNPGQPPDTTATIGPEEQADGPRAFQYTAGRNLIRTPRGDEPQVTAFAQLRSLADTFDIARICIEYVKDQVSSTRWDVVSKSVAEGSRNATTPEASIAAAKAFLASPDGERALAKWLRVAIEEMLVVDALSIYKAPTKGGQLHSLQIVAGDTIKPLVDRRGRRPIPPDPAYQQVLFGAIYGSWTSEELIYAPMNPRANSAYGQSPLERILITINTAVRKQLFELAYFKDGNTPDALIGVNVGAATAAQISSMQEWFDTRLKGDPENRRGVTMFPVSTGSDAKGGGMDIYEFRTPVWERMLEEWLLQITCAAMYVTPQEIGFTNHVNRATAEGQENAQFRRLRPIYDHLASIFTEHYLSAIDPDLEFVWLEDKPEEDALKDAQVDQILINTGQRSIDELREERGQDPWNIPASKEPILVVGNQVVMLRDVEAVSEKSAAPPQPPPDFGGMKPAPAGIGGTGGGDVDQTSSPPDKTGDQELKRLDLYLAKGEQAGKARRPFRTQRAGPVVREGRDRTPKARTA